LLDTVRNRALNLALELKDEVGDDDAALKQHPQTTTALVERTVFQNVIGDVYIATDRASIQVQKNTLTPGDWTQLAKALDSAGIAPSEAQGLSQAIKDDKTSMGNRVMSWIKQQAPNVVTGGVRMSASVGQAILTEYLKQHFGIH
jgi:hypothetical protein